MVLYLLSSINRYCLSRRVKCSVRDGNTWRDSHSVDKEPLVAQLIGGIHYQRKTWAIHWTGVITSDVVDTDKVTEAEGDNSFATVTIEVFF